MSWASQNSTPLETHRCNVKKIIDNSAISKLMRDTRFTDRFPFLLLGKYSSSTARARCCSGKDSGQDFNRVKQALASMSVADKEELKRMLNVSSAKIVYLDHRKKKQVADF